MTFFKCGVSSYVFWRWQNCSLTILPARWCKCMIYPALSCFVFSWLYRFGFMNRQHWHKRALPVWMIFIFKNPGFFYQCNSLKFKNSIKSMSAQKSHTFICVNTDWNWCLLENDGTPWMAHALEHFAHLRMTPLETREISNYGTLVPRNRPLSILQMNMLSLNNFLNKNGSAHYEIFTTQFSCSTRLWKDP